MQVALRKLCLDDAKALAQAVNNKKVQDNLRDGLPFPYTEKDGLDYISGVLAADGKTSFTWAITVSGEVAGNIGVFPKDNVHRFTAEIGYYIGERFWGKGICTQAVKAACEWVFQNTDIIRIFAEPYSFNAASCRVLEKAGFSLEGVLRKNAIKNGEIADCKMYALIKGE